MALLLCMRIETNVEIKSFNSNINHLTHLIDFLGMIQRICEKDIQALYISN